MLYDEHPPAEPSPILSASPDPAALEATAPPKDMRSAIDVLFTPRPHVDDEVRAYLETLPIGPKGRVTRELSRLAAAARKYMATPATAAPAERPFSVAGQVMSDRRSDESGNSRYARLPPQHLGILKSRHHSDRCASLCDLPRRPHQQHQHVGVRQLPIQLPQEPCHLKTLIHSRSYIMSPFHANHRALFV